MEKEFQLIYENAETLYAHGCYNEALLEFQKIEWYEKYADIKNYIGCCYLNTDKFSEAKNCFETLHKRFPDWENPLFNLGRIYIKLKEFSEAEWYLKEALKINPNSPDANFYMALYYEKNNNFKSAIEFYNRSAKLENSIECHLNLTICYQKIGNFDSALKEANKAYNMEKCDSDVVYNLTYILILQKCYEDAYKILDNDFWINCDDVGILNNFLFSAIKTSQFFVAEIVAKKIICLDPKNSLANDFLKQSRGASLIDG